MARALPNRYSHLLNKGLRGLDDHFADVGVLPREGWPFVAQSDGVVYDQHLSVAGGPGSDPDRRDGDGARHGFRQRVRDVLEHHEISACGGNTQGFVQHAPGILRRAPHLLEVRGRLRREPRMADNSDAARHKMADHSVLGPSSFTLSAPASSRSLALCNAVCGSRSLL